MSRGFKNNYKWGKACLSARQKKTQTN